jgi:GH35 family endo-1,4-beta-xylanase
MTAWDITPDTITHTASPEFSASWLSGGVDLETIEGPFHYAENSGQDDQLLIFGFNWKNSPPSAAHFETLMGEAVSALDNWISDRM